MSIHLQREIENLKKKILSLGAIVEQAVQQATESIEQADADLASQVIEQDLRIDDTEVEVEEDCLKILALYQPVATDLRFIIAVLKINNDLERIGDLAVNIAERGKFLATQPKPDISFDFAKMSGYARQMLKTSLDSLVDFSAEEAGRVCESDDAVDSMNRQMYLMVQDSIRENINQIESLIHLLSVSRHLERIGDHATNIAEDVIYMVQGQIIRHKTENYK